MVPKASLNMCSTRHSTSACRVSSNVAEIRPISETSQAVPSMTVDQITAALRRSNLGAILLLTAGKHLECEPLFTQISFVCVYLVYVPALEGGILCNHFAHLNPQGIHGMSSWFLICVDWWQQGEQLCLCTAQNRALRLTQQLSQQRCSRCCLSSRRLS